MFSADPLSPCSLLHRARNMLCLKGKQPNQRMHIEMVHCIYFMLQSGAAACSSAVSGQMQSGLTKAAASVALQAAACPVQWESQAPQAHPWAGRPAPAWGMVHFSSATFRCRLTHLRPMWRPRRCLSCTGGFLGTLEISPTRPYSTCASYQARVCHSWHLCRLHLSQSLQEARQWLLC